MNSCNLRGFMFASGSKVCFTKNCRSTLKRGDEGFIFPFSETFEIFQNGIFDVGNEKEYDVYLKNDDKKICVHLGTTSYQIFPNTSIPLSFPFFSFLMKDSYLFVKTGDDYPVITLTFEGGVVNREFKTSEVSNQKYEYHSTYILKKTELYEYENQNIHKPIITTIIYSD